MARREMGILDVRHSRRAAIQGLGGGALALAGVIALHAGASAKATPMLATPAAGSNLIQQWAAGWSHLGDPSILLGVVTDDVTYEDVAVGEVLRGRAALRQLLTTAGAAIPNFTISVLTSLVTEQMGAAEYRISGTQSGDLPYLKATGKPFSIRASSVFALQDGKIRRESRYYDMVQFLRQLGGLHTATFDSLGTPPAEPGGES